MKLHIFGHSICYPGKDSFIDILSSKYDVTLHFALAGTEERILYFLKKTKDIDLAVIFHGDPGYIFVPTLERDVSPSKENETEFWDNLYYTNLKYFENVKRDSSTPSVTIENIDNFKLAFHYHLKYFYTNDLLINRHNGALMQIDQYLSYKKIPAIHCLLERSKPSWFSFSSGIVDSELTKLQRFESPYSCSHRLSMNRINAEGNKLIADTIEQYIATLIKTG